MNPAEALFNLHDRDDNPWDKEDHTEDCDKDGDPTRDALFFLLLCFLFVFSCNFTIFTVGRGGWRWVWPVRVYRILRIICGVVSLGLVDYNFIIVVVIIAAVWLRGFDHNVLFVNDETTTTVIVFSLNSKLKCNFRPLMLKRQLSRVVFNGENALILRADLADLVLTEER